MSTPGALSRNPSKEASEVSRPSFRPLAPKTKLPIQPRSYHPRSLIVPSSLPYRANRLALCPVCSRRGCQLKSHKALISHISRRGSLAPSENGSITLSTSKAERLKQSAYTKSYAYFYAQIYVDADIAASRVDAFFELPLPCGVNKPEMNMLFLKCANFPGNLPWLFPYSNTSPDFTAESNRTINIPRPPELSNDLVLSPFFLPAMTDSALCLAILAASAASLPQRSGRPAENVAVLTLFDQAMYQLRERLSSSPGEVSDTTVAAATFLWGINALLNDPDSMRQHGKSVHALVAGRGGLSNLGLCGAVARLVVMVDSLNAITFAELALYPNRVEVPPLEDEPPPVCGAYFRSERSQKSIDTALNNICMKSAGVANLMERMIRTRSTTTEYFHAMSMLSRIGTDIINIYVKFKNTGTKDECTCLAVMLTNILLYYKPREQQMMVTTQAGRLIRALHQKEIPSYWLGNMELLVWILFILAMIPHDFDGKEWAMDLLSQAMCSRFGSESWPDDWQETVHQAVLQFVWSDVRLSEGFATICRSLTLRVFGDNENG